MSTKKQAGAAPRQNQPRLRGYIGEAGGYIVGCLVNEILLGDLVRRGQTKECVHRNQGVKAT